MNVGELKEKLSEYPDDMLVLLHDELGNDDIRDNDFEVDELQLCWYPEFNGNGKPYEQWEYPDVFPRKIIKTERVLLIGVGYG